MGNQHPYSNGNLPQGLNFAPSSGVKFKKGEIERTSQTLGSDRTQVDNVLGRTNATDITFPYYGVAAMDLYSKHIEARNSHAKVLTVAKEVLASWETALREADKRYTKADDDSPINQLQDMPNTNLPNGSLPNTNFPNANLPNTNPNYTNPNYTNPNFTNPDLANPDLKNPDLGNPDLKNPDLASPDLGNPDLGSPDLGSPGLGSPDLGSPDFTNPDLANPDLKNPDLGNPDFKNPDLANPDLKNPDLANPNLSDPTKTGLSGYDPSTTPSIQQPRLPESTPSVDPGRFTTGSPGPGTGIGTGVGAPGTGNQVPALAKGAVNGLGGMGGMPFMPMGGMGGAGGEREKDGSTSDLLRGDEEDWGMDEDVAPAVLQHRDV